MKKRSPRAIANQARRRRRLTAMPSTAKAPRTMPLRPRVGGLNEHLVVVFEPSLFVVVSVPFAFAMTLALMSMLKENSVAS